MHTHHPEPSPSRAARPFTASDWLYRARCALSQLRDLLTNDLYAGDSEFRLALAEDLLCEIESLGLAARRPTVLRTAAHVRAAIGLPTVESTVPMPVETAIAFLALAIDPPVTEEVSNSG